MAKNFTFFYTVTFLLYYTTSFSQDFIRIEQNAGFQNVSKNNGIAVADYDGDNDLDIFIVNIQKEVPGNVDTRSKLFRNNNNGTFTDVTEQAGLLNLLLESDLDSRYDNFQGLIGYKFGAFWGDYDNDGFPDLLFTHMAHVQLFKNNGNGTFTEKTTSSGITERNECNNTSAAWFDYNNDGYLDIYISDWRGCNGNILYKNNKDGTFTDKSSIIHQNGSENFPSFTPFPFDYNHDGWMDLYLSNDLHEPNELFINNQGAGFSEEAHEYKMDIKDDDMSISCSDYNQDGLFDFFVTAIDNNELLLNSGFGYYLNRADENNLGSSDFAWGTTFADFDLDTDEDLLVVNGFDEGYRGPELNKFYRSTYANGGSEFIEEQGNMHANFGISVEVVDFDYDNDGDLDVMITNSDRNILFYENKAIDGQVNDLQWLKISLEGTTSNRNAIGSILTLHTDNGSLKRYYNGVGFLGQSIKPVHFGIAKDALIQSLIIQWPSGLIETHTDISPNTFIKATEAGGITAIDTESSPKERGCTDPNSCNYNPNAIIDDGSCEYLSVSNTIVGPSNSHYFSTATYSYPLQTNQHIVWNVEGGEIIDDAHSSSITVKWGFRDTGILQATVTNNQCSSPVIEKVVYIEPGTNVSIARLWNEATLLAIRNDYARPTVHARNLFHTSAAMYDAWATFNRNKTYLLGNSIGNYTSSFTTFPLNGQNKNEELDKAISFAVYRLLSHRFAHSPNPSITQEKLDLLMEQLGYDIYFIDKEYSSGNAAALGNYIAYEYIQYGHSDGARENTGYDNLFYEPVNLPLAPTLPGNPTITDPNRWQSLSLDTYIDQSGNIIEGSSIDFLSPEWGKVNGFALTESSLSTFMREGNQYSVHHDPGTPPFLSTSDLESTTGYQWNFSLVALWSSHLDPFDGVIWDISPNSIGNTPTENYPTDYQDFSTFYNEFEGGTIDQGYSVNPVTGHSYAENLVPRGDYTRVLAEYWADGPDSETPPGHWFTLLNFVNDKPQLVKKWTGKGDILPTLEWDIKSYFTLGGAMHDAAVTAWGIKGWYDYIRPISAIRYMADLGQSTHQDLENYHPHGIPLIEGYIGIVNEQDALAGRDKEHVGKIKLLAWKGHKFIGDTENEQAGVDWILAEEWWPYQRPSFVTPPFAGYVSGHSTYSRAAAEVLTEITGSPYFPGGLAQVVARKNKFLVFEEGPSTDVVLQWVSYRDAADQCSLSRIWGGIHPPIDDLPGRRIGETVGQDAFAKAMTYFKQVENESVTENTMLVYPNPVRVNGELTITNTKASDKFSLYSLAGRQMHIVQTFLPEKQSTIVDIGSIAKGMYILSLGDSQWKIVVL